MTSSVCSFFPFQVWEKRQHHCHTYTHTDTGTGRSDGSKLIVAFKLTNYRLLPLPRRLRATQTDPPTNTTTRKWVMQSRESFTCFLRFFIAFEDPSHRLGVEFNDTGIFKNYQTLLSVRDCHRACPIRGSFPYTVSL